MFVFSASEIEAMDYMARKRNVRPVNYKSSVQVVVNSETVSHENSVCVVSDSDEEQYHGERMVLETVPIVDDSISPETQADVQAIDMSTQTHDMAAVDISTQTDSSPIHHAVGVATQTDNPAIMFEPIPSTSGNYIQLAQCKLEKSHADAMKCIRKLNERLGDEIIADSSDEAYQVDTISVGDCDEERFSDIGDDKLQYDGLFARGYGFFTNVSTTSDVQ